MLPFFFKKKKTKSHFEILKNKWEERYKKAQENLWTKHGDVLHTFLHASKQWSFGTVAGLVMLASSGGQAVASVTPSILKETPLDLNKETSFLLDLVTYVPREVRPLTGEEEKKITEILSNKVKLPVTAELQGMRLNTNYGYIGQEQHLARFPGDTMYGHLETQGDEKLYSSYGMAPGLGAWRYFAPSQDAMTEKDNLREKYYIAVQTFLSPGYSDDVKKHNEFFKYRKVLVVNPQNGKAVVTDIADAGPSPWTGKQLGGSPEVMHYLERVDGAQKGPVLFFFIDDPLDTVALGPVGL